MKKAVVLGATGGMGSALVQELVSRGIETVAFARSREKLAALAERCGNDTRLARYAGDALRVDDIVAAARGADVIFHSVNLPYADWNAKLLPLAAGIVEAARAVGAKVVDIDNIYPYGKSRMTPAGEDHPKQPHTRKGKLRLELEHALMNAHREGVPVLIARLPDFYGPYATNTLLYTTFQAMVRRKAAVFVGDLDTPREYVYMPDAAKAVVEAALRDDAYGQTWHIPGAGVIPGREIVAIVREMTGTVKPVRPIGKKMFAFLGLFSPFMKEVAEMLYLTEEPFVLSGAKYEQQIGPIPKTPYEQGIRETIREMMKQHR